MKKTLLFTMALSVLAIACTKSEVVKAPGRGQEIKFDTYMGRVPVTKATSADLTTLQKPTEEDGGIQVTAFIHNGIMDKVANPSYEDNSVYGNANAEMYDTANFPDTDPYMNEVLWWADGWKYDGVVYWPDYHPNRKLAFVAYALNAKDCIVFDDDERTGETNAGKSYTKFTFEVKDNVKDQKDLLVTEFQPNLGANEQAEVDPVNLDFKHLLSKVGFQVVANQGVEGVDITIKGIVLNGRFPKFGKVDLLGMAEIDPILDGDMADNYKFFSANEFFVTPSSTEPKDIFANNVPKKDVGEDGETLYERNDDDSNRYLMIMPSTQESASVEVTYQLTGQKQEQVAIVPLPENFVFKSGTSYIFKFSVSTLAISFDIEVEEWIENEMDTEEGTNEKGEYPLAPEA